MISTKRQTFIMGLLFFLIVCSFGLGYFAYTQQQKIQSQNAQIKEEQTQKQTARFQLKKEHAQLAEVQTALEKKKECVNNDKTSPKFQGFSQVMTDYFTKMMTYTPDTYGKRKEQIKTYLTDALYQHYFSNKQTVGDSNQVSSRSKSIQLYAQAWQGSGNLHGLVVANFETSVDQSGWKEGKNVFEVSYNPSTKKIEAVQNLGSSYTGDMIQ